MVKCAALTVGLSLLLGLTVNYRATTVEELSLSDLAIRSRSIVQGTVRSTEARWTTDRKLILTTTMVEVHETLKGQPPRFVSVTTLGGRIGSSELVVAGMPVFKVGESVVVFLEDAGAYQTVLG